MKKLFITLLVFIFGFSTAIWAFEVNTTLSKANQQIITNQLDQIWGNFQINLNAIPLQTRIDNLKVVVSKIDQMLVGEKKETNKFVLLYLRYLVSEDLNRLNLELENNNNSNTGGTGTSDNNNNNNESLNGNDTIVWDLLPQNELNQTLFLAWTRDNRIMAFRIMANFDNIRLKQLVFNWSGLENLQNFRLLTPTGEQIPASSTTSNEIVFSAINSSSNYVIPRNTAAFFNIIADTNSWVNSKNFSLTLNAANSILLSSVWRDVALSGWNISTETMTIMNTAMFASKVQNPNKNLITWALTFNVTAFGNNGATLAKATFNNIFSGYDMTNASLKVYRNTIANRNLLGSTAIGTVTWDVIFTDNNIIDAGNTNTYVVVVDGATLDPAARSQSWIISMLDLVTDSGIHLGDFTNTWDFPITEVN